MCGLPPEGEHQPLILLFLRFWCAHRSKSRHVFSSFKVWIQRQNDTSENSSIFVPGTTPPFSKWAIWNGPGFCLGGNFLSVIRVRFGRLDSKRHVRVLLAKILKSTCRLFSFRDAFSWLNAVTVWRGKAYLFPVTPSQKKKTNNAVFYTKSEAYKRKHTKCVRLSKQKGFGHGNVPDRCTKRLITTIV